MVYISHRLARGPGDHRPHRLPARRRSRWPSCRRSEATRDKLVEFLAGAGGIYVDRRRGAAAGTPEVVLSVRGRVSFDLHAGEILGLAGLVGAGRTSVLRELFGGRPGRQPDNLQVKVRGQAVAIDSPATRSAPASRWSPRSAASQGLILDMLVERNIALPSLQRVPARGRERRSRAPYMKQFGIRGGGPASMLSGGNQQKIVLSKWMAMSPDGAAARRADARPRHPRQARRARRRARAGRRGQGRHRLELRGRRDRGALPPRPGAQPGRDRAASCAARS